MPQVGECLEDLSDRPFVGPKTVDCDSAEASYEIVVKAGSSADGYGVCDDHPDGEILQRENDEPSKRGEVAWEICAVPV